MKLAPLLSLLAWGQVLGVGQPSPVLLDPRLSPGDVLSTDTQLICQPGYSKTVRNVPGALKNQVYRAYGITLRQPGAYEIDHIVSLELGGSNSVQNLFPESYQTQPLNAHVKNRLENRLHALVCSGTLDIAVAQQAIASNWTLAYQTYVGPLPGGARPVMPGKTSALEGPAAVTVTPVASPLIVPAAQPTITSAGTAPDADGGCPASAPVKVSRAGIYHLPQGDGSYASTQARRCFLDGPAAQAAGYRAPR